MEAKRLTSQKEDEKEGPGESEAAGSRQHALREPDMARCCPAVAGLTAPELWLQACFPSLGRGPPHLGSKSQAAGEGP